MDLTKLQVAYQNVVAEIAKAYFANYDFVADPRRLIAAERACFGLLKLECAAKLRANPDDIVILNILSGASNLHRETARVIRKGISNRAQGREGQWRGQASGPGPQSEAKQASGGDAKQGRETQYEGGQREQKSGTDAESHSQEKRRDESCVYIRTAIVWLILISVACFLLHEYWWVVELILKLIIEVAMLAIMWLFLMAITSYE